MKRSQKVRAVVVATSMAVLTAAGLGHASATSASSSAPASAQGTTASCPTLQLGDQGQGVKELQYRLRAYGYGVGIDGVFGPQTDKAVRHLQRVSGLLQDGIVGPITQKALGCGRVAPSAPAPAPAPTPRAAAPAPAQGGWHDLAIAAGWTEAQWPNVACIINRESRGQPGAYNSSGASGLMQILKRYHPGVNLFDPYTNLRVAHEMFLQRGWQPWALAGSRCL